MQTAVTVRNDGPPVAALRFRTVPSGKVSVSARGDQKIAAASVKSFDLVLTPVKAGTTFKGSLAVLGAGSAPGTIPLMLASKKSAPGWLYLVLFATAGGALGFVTVRYLAFKRKLGALLGSSLDASIGSPNWDFSKSWASNLTVIGALLGTILSAGVLPDATVVAKATYAGLNLLFGILILLAPLVYSATQRESLVNRTSTTPEPQRQGTVFWFLFSCTLTLWAVAGELTTIGLLFREIRSSESLPAAAVWTMWSAIVFGAVMLVLYTWASIGSILKTQSNTIELQRKKHQELQTRLIPLYQSRHLGLQTLLYSTMGESERKSFLEDTTRLLSGSPELDEVLNFDQSRVQPELPSWSLL